MIRYLNSFAARVFLILGLVWGVAHAQEYALPSNLAAYNWIVNTVNGPGVVGGIPIRTRTYNTVSYGADNTGVSSSTSAFSAAAVPARGDGVVYLPAGVYTGSLPTNVLDLNDGVTYRGAGSYVRSTSTVTLGTGSKTFTVPANQAWTAGCGIWIYGWNDDSHGMRGTVSSYSGISLVVNAASFFGSGTYSDWQVNITTLAVSGRVGVAIGSDIDFSQSSCTNANITGGLTKGSQTLTLASGQGSNLHSDGAGMIYLNNDPDPNELVISVKGLIQQRYQFVHIDTVSGDTVTFHPALQCTFPYTTGAFIREPEAALANATLHYIGLEDMCLDGALSGGTTDNCLQINSVDNVWTKNIQIHGYNRFGLQAQVNTNLEINNCTFATGASGGPGHAGAIILTCTNARVVNNIFYDGGGNLQMDQGCIGCVVEYNFLTRGISNQNLLPNHEPHSSYNLFEGNVTPSVQVENYWGSCSKMVFFRNWMHAYDPNYGAVFAIELNRFCRQFSLVGNICQSPGTTYSRDEYDGWGYPNIGNASFHGSSQPTIGVYDYDWNTSTNRPKTWHGTVTTQTDSAHGQITVDDDATADDLKGHIAHTDGGETGCGFVNQYILLSWVSGRIFNSSVAGSPGLSNQIPPVGTSADMYPGALGFQSIDLDVFSTALRKKNYRYFDHSIPVDESIGSMTLAASWCEPSRPSFFGSGSHPWPLWDPDNPPTALDAATMSKQPAADKYFNGPNVVSPAPETPRQPIGRYRRGLIRL